MAPALWIQFFYKGQSFDYGVKDVDRLQLIDLLWDIDDTSLKQNVLVPWEYDMFYKSGGRKMYIKSDLNLLDMLLDVSAYEGNTINVWLEETKTPLKQFAMFRSLKKTHMEKEEREKKELEEKRKMEAMFVDVPPLSMEVPLVNLDGDSDMSYFRVFGTEESTTPSNEPTPPQKQPTEPSQQPNPPPKQPSPPPEKPHSPPIQPPAPQKQPPPPPRQPPPPQKQPSSQHVPTCDRFLEMSFNVSNSSPSPKRRKIVKKMPKSTARRKMSTLQFQPIPPNQSTSPPNQPTSPPNQPTSPPNQPTPPPPNQHTSPPPNQLTQPPKQPTPPPSNQPTLPPPNQPTPNQTFRSEFTPTRTTINSAEFQISSESDSSDAISDEDFVWRSESDSESDSDVSLIDEDNVSDMEAEMVGSDFGLGRSFDTSIYDMVNGEDVDDTLVQRLVVISHRGTVQRLVFYRGVWCTKCKPQGHIVHTM